MSAREDSITTPRAFVDYLLKVRNLRLPPIPAHCIVAHSGLLIEQARRQWPHCSVDIGSRNPTLIHFFDPPGQRPFAMVAAPHGAPMAALLLEELIALGFEKFLNVGPAGAPADDGQPTARLGDLVLVDAALIHEGTSAHYETLDTVAPDAGMLARLRAVLERGGVPFRTGRVATTDAIYRETPAFVRDIVRRGACAIDMESSAMFSVCRFHGKDIAALLFISDIVGRSAGWEVAFIDDAVNRTEAALLPLLVDCIDAS